MSTSVEYFGSPEHLLDQQKVSSAHDNDRARRIMNLEATTEEVLSWYGSEDPLSEQNNLDWMRRRYDSNRTDDTIRREMLRETVLQMMVDEGAALTILANKAGITEGGQPGVPWTETHHDAALRRTLLFNPSKFGARLLDRALGNITDEDLPELYIAADCLHSTGLNYAYFGHEMSRDKVAFPESDHFVAQSKQYIADTYRLAKAMFVTHLEDKPLEELVAGRPMLHKLAAFMCSVSFEMSTLQTGTEAAKRQKEGFELMTTAIAASFLAYDDDKNKVIKGTEKGDLYEMLYLMDLNYLFTKNRRPDFDWHARATTTRHDRPEVNNPSHRRGYDFMATNGDHSVVIQAKVNLSQEERRKQTDPNYRDYHPWILQVGERSFDSAKKTTLLKKLEAYEEWLDVGMPQEGSAKLDRHVLPSAQEAFEACVAEQRMKPSERMIRNLGGNLTRAERRRLMRSSGDFKKRNAKK